MLWKNGDNCQIELDNGIVVDYVKGAFVIVLKDDVWQEYERDALLKHKVHISFLYERVCALFMLSVEDAIETSDTSFDIHECEAAKDIISIGQGECYAIEIYLIDKQNQICAARKVTLSLTATLLMKEAFIKQLDTPYNEEGFDRALLKIQGVQHPFELEERADFHEIF